MSGSTDSDGGEIPCEGIERGELRARSERIAALPDPDRRRLLVGMGTTGILGLAGCLEDDGTRHTVGFHHDSRRTEVEVSEDDILLYPALDAGVEIPYRCEVGRCGDCTVKYDGDATDVAVHDGNRYLSDEQISNGWILTCVAYARGDFDAEVTQPGGD